MADDDRRTAGPTNPIDPRLRARRAHVTRTRVRRRRLVALSIMALVFVAAGGWALLYRSPAFDVDRVSVSGNDHTSTDQLRRTAAVRRGMPLASVDLAAVRRRVEAQPWVVQASVDRRWPGTIRVRVIERTPVAVVGTGRAAMLVDRTGRVLGPAPAKAALPAVVGPPAKAGTRLSRSSQPLMGVLGDLPPELRRQVAEAQSNPTGLTFTLTDGVKVRWGDDRATAEKAQSLLLLLAKADRATIATVDVSVPSAAALTREDGPVA